MESCDGSVDNGLPRRVIRLVVTDLDGTFWDESRVVPPAHVRAVRELHERGVTVMVATSRRARIVGPQLARSGLSLPAVLMDGAMGVDFRDGRRFHQTSFPPGAAPRTLAVFRAHGLEPCVYVDSPAHDVVVSTKPSTSPAHVERLGKWAVVGDLDEAASSVVYGFSVLGRDRGTLSAVAEALNDDGSAEVVLFPEPVYGQFGITVGPKGVSKWTGVLAYCMHHSLSPEEVLAVGDGENDLSMMRSAGVAVGVRGSVTESFVATQYVIDPPTSSGWPAVLGLL